MLTCTALMATSQPYSFKVSSGTYTHLSNSTSLNSGITWDDPNFKVPIGFVFQFFNNPIQEIYIDDFGLGGFLMTDTNSSGITSLLIPYNLDIVDRGSDTSNFQGQPGSLSPISYELSGNVGSQILKIEWRNVGFRDDLADDNNATDFTNFQLWLYEGSNIVEMHYGPSSILQPQISFGGAPGPAVGMFPSFDVANDTTTAYGLSLDGAPTSPTMLNQAILSFLNAPIPNGTIYTFTPSTVGIESMGNLSSDVLLYPNPTNTTLNLDFQNVEFDIDQIYLLSAEGIKLKKLNVRNTKLDLTAFSPGVYFICLESNNERVVKKFLKL